MRYAFAVSVLAVLLLTGGASPAHAQQRDFGQLLTLGMKEVVHHVEEGTCLNLFAAMQLSRVMEWIAAFDTTHPNQAREYSEIRTMIEEDFFGRPECTYPSDYETLPVVGGRTAGGGGTVEALMMKGMPPFILALQYMTEAERKAFMEHLSEPHRAMVREWEAQHRDEVQQLREELQVNLTPLRLQDVLQQQQEAETPTLQLSPELIQQLQQATPQTIYVQPQDPDGN